MVSATSRSASAGNGNLIVKRAIVALFVVLATLPAFAQEKLHWYTDPDEGLAAARARRAIVFLYFRALCGTCTSQLDTAMQDALANPMFVGTLDSFVLLRVTSASPRHSLLDAYLGPLPQSSIALHDASGVPLTYVNIIDRVEEAGEEGSARRDERNRSPLTIL